MNDDNNRQYGFDHYERMPLGQPGLLERIFGSRMAYTLKSPMVATAGLLLVGVIFAGLIIASYPESSDEANAPIVRADKTAFKQMPDAPGGMSVQNEDSTIYMSMNDQQISEQAPVENLLGESEESLEEFSRQIEELAAREEQKQADDQEIMEVTSAVSDESGAEIESLFATQSDDASTEIDSQTEQSAKQEDLLEIAQATPPQEEMDAPEPSLSETSTQPETLEFVKSVLDKKDASAVTRAAPTKIHTETTTASVDKKIDARDVAEAVNGIKPAAGSQVAAAILPGDYYVQLASVSSPTGAASEWGKIRDQFSAQLSGLDHRVVSADLGERGVFYRIQAGPMSKDSAASVCEKIKAQKPGGCLVTK